ncbi:hypothetical protein D3C85_1489390 [compost metagenome]
MGSDVSFHAVAQFHVFALSSEVSGTDIRVNIDAVAQGVLVAGFQRRAVAILVIAARHALPPVSAGAQVIVEVVELDHTVDVVTDRAQIGGIKSHTVAADLAAVTTLLH